jgi:hypothetical protein
MLSKASFLNIRQKKKLAALRSGRASNATSRGPPLHLNGASMGVVRVAPSGSERDEWRCRVLTCPNKNYHRLKECSAFLKMTVGARTGLALREGLCRVCLTIGHGTSGKKCIFAEDNNEVCKQVRCKGAHHALLQPDPEGERTCHPSPQRLW